jgi:hypothetical protein
MSWPASYRGRTLESALAAHAAKSGARAAHMCCDLTQNEQAELANDQEVGSRG